MILPDSADRAVVVFHLWRSLAYSSRLALSFSLIFTGFAVQFVTATILPGVVLIALGNLLLLVRGYDNRVDYAKLDPAAAWERVEAKRLTEILDLDRQIRRWDTSALDATNPLGGVLFGVIVILTGGLAWFTRGPLQVLVVDAMVLLVPHWLTGVRSILVLPKLMVRARAVHQVLQDGARELGRHQVHLVMLLRGDATKIPDDLKFKVDIAGHHEDFLGLYGQIVLNEVQGKSYPYFYVVLVARRGFGLGEVAGACSAPQGMTCEFKLQDQVEVLVLRQTTTKKSGYHTKPAVSLEILSAGLKLAERVAVGGQA